MARVFTGLFVLFALARPAAADGEGAFLYAEHCAVCHQPNGEGTVGFIPPLQGNVGPLATHEEGRTYLIQVVGRGMIGPIHVQGQMYMSTMPAFAEQLDGPTIAVVLNYVASTLDPPSESKSMTPFTPEEVAATHETVLTPNEVHAMRGRVRGKEGTGS